MHDITVRRYKQLGEKSNSETSDGPMVVYEQPIIEDLVRAIYSAIASSGREEVASHSALVLRKEKLKELDCA